ATLFGIQAQSLELFELLVGSGGAEVGSAAFPGAKPHIDGAFEKMLAKFLDPKMPLRLLPPYQGATDAAFEAFLKRVGERLPAWLPPAGFHPLGLTPLRPMGAVADDQQPRGLVSNLFDIVRDCRVP